MADPRVQGIVEFVLKEKGLLDASARLRALESQIKDTQGTMLNLGRAGEALGSALRTYIAPLAILNFFRTSALDMLQFQKQLAGTAQTIRALGGDASKEIPRVQSFLGAIQGATGIIDDETLPAFQKLLGITESVPAAMEGIGLAARVARSGAMEFGEAAQAITDVMAGKLTQAAKNLGIALVDSNGRVRDAAEVLRELDERLAELDLEKQATGVKALSAAWDNFSDSAANVFIPVMNVASRVLQAFLNVGTLLFKVIEGGAIAFANLALQIANFGTGLYGLMTGKGLEGFSKFDDATAELHQQLKDLLTTSDDVDKSLANTTENLAKAAARIRGAGDDGGLRDRLAAERALLDSQIALAEEGSRRRLELQLRALEVERSEKVKAAGKDLDAIAAIYETYDNRRRKLEEDYTKFQAGEAEKRSKAEEEMQSRAAESLRKALADGKKVLEERIKAEEKLKKLIGDFAEESAEAFLKRLELERDADDALLDARREALEQQASLAKDYGWEISDEKVRIEAETIQRIANLQIEALAVQRDREIAAAEAIGADTAAIRAKYDTIIRANVKASEAAQSKLYKESAEYRTLFWMQYTKDAIAALSAVFGESKAAAIAQAAIETAMGIIKIWSEWGWNPPVAAALTALAGMQFAAQVATIKKSNYGGKGFDDPLSDREARFGGQRWARDFVRETAAGFRIGLQDARLSERLAASVSETRNTTTSTTYDNSTGQVIHVHGTLIDSESLRTLSRRLAETQRNDAARFQR